MYAHGCSTSSCSSSSIMSGDGSVRPGTWMCSWCARPGAGSSEFRATCRPGAGSSKFLASRRPGTWSSKRAMSSPKYQFVRTVSKVPWRSVIQGNMVRTILHTLVISIRRCLCQSSFATERCSRSGRRVFCLRPLDGLCPFHPCLCRMSCLRACLSRPCSSFHSMVSSSRPARTLGHHSSGSCDHRLGMNYSSLVQRFLVDF